MAREYVETRDSGYYVIGSRVSLESVICLFLEGASPETIVDEFPTLSLEQVYGAITFYLADRAKIDAYLTESERLWEDARKDQSPTRLSKLANVLTGTRGPAAPLCGKAAPFCTASGKAAGHASLNAAQFGQA